MPVEVRELTVDLHKRYSAPKPGRANKSINVIRLKVSKIFHIPLDSVKLSNSVNEAVWAHGRTKPPHSIQLALKKDEDQVQVFLFSEMDQIKKDMADEKKKKDEKKSAKKESRKEESDLIKQDEVISVEDAEKQKQKKEIEQAAESAGHKR